MSGGRATVAISERVTGAPILLLCQIPAAIGSVEVGGHRDHRTRR